MPGQVAARPRPRVEAGLARPAPRPLAACPAPTSSATARRPLARAGERVEQRLDRLEAVGPGDQRLARLVLADLRREPRPLGLADVGEVGERAGRSAPSGSPASEPTPRRTTSTRRQAEPLGVGLRDLERVRRGVDRGHPRVRAARRRPRARSRRCRCRRRAPRGPQLERHLDEQLGLGPRDQHAPVDRAARSGGSPCGRGCRRPARAARRRRTISPNARAASDRRAAARARRRAAPGPSPVASASSSSASSRGVSTPAAASASTAAAERLARRCRRGTARSAPSRPSAPRAAGASPRPRARR